MFGDFQCPYCLGAQSVIRRVRERLGDSLLFAYRHLPIPERHPLAPLAAEAKRGRRRAGEVLGVPRRPLPGAAEALPGDDARWVGRDLGLDADRMAAEMDSGEHRPRVERDLDSAARSGATGTPSFYVNGVHFFGTVRRPLAGGRAGGLGTGGSAARSGGDLDDHSSFARAVVEVDQDQLLPGAEGEPAPTIGTISDGPTIVARWWAWELVSWLSRLCS